MVRRPLHNIVQKVCNFLMRNQDNFDNLLVRNTNNKQQW